VSEKIGRVFPAGKPVPGELVIGRRGEIASLRRLLEEQISTLVSGERRIGKTTLCDAAAAELHEAEGVLIVKIEVPARDNGLSFELLQLIVDKCGTAAQSVTKRKLLRATRPVIEEILKRQGLPLDLRELGAEPALTTVRRVISLPFHAARDLDRKVIFYLDELQRVADYADGDTFISDLVDVYANTEAADHVTVLVNGSDTRALDLLDRDLRLGKLCKRFELGSTIPAGEWRSGLRDHYKRAALEIADDALEMLIEFGDERPYPTMLAARNSGFSAQEVGGSIVDVPAVTFGIDEAERQLRDERL
jgi:hypothetical protein